MKNLHELLTDADPVAEMPELPTEEALGIRRAVVAAAETHSARTRLWPRVVAVAALVVVMIAAGMAVSRKVPPADEIAKSPAVQAIEVGERRQLQFATPGGTRVIWTLDPEFELQRGTP